MNAQPPCKCAPISEENVIGSTGTVTLLSSISNKFPTALLDGCYLIRGTLVIDWSNAGPSSPGQAYFEFGPNATLRMDRDASIEVKEFYELRINGSYLMGCDFLWSGINVKSNGTIECVGAHIFDAVKAIAFTQKSKLLLTDTEFVNNYIGLAANGATSPTIPGTGSVMLLDQIVRNKFLRKGDLLLKFPSTVLNKGKPFIGIELQNLNGFAVGHLTSINDKNEYADHSYGVFIQNCKAVKVAHDFYHDMFNKSASPTGQLSDDAAIRIRNSNDVEVFENKIRDVNCGVRSDHSSVNIHDNGITPQFTIPPLNGFSPVQVGIFVEATINKKVVIRHNEIKPSFSGTGIYVDNFKSSFPKSQLVIDGQNEISLPAGAFEAAQGIAIAYVNGPVRILNNTIRGKINGLSIFQSDSYSEGLADALVKDNIVVEDILTGPYYSHWGYNIKNTSGYQFVHNIFDGLKSTQDPNDLSSFGQGFEIRDSPNNLFCCNNTEGTRNGFIFDGACNPTLFKNSNFGYHDWTLFLKYGTQIGEQFEPGNDWNNDPSAANAYFQLDINPDPGEPTVAEQIENNRFFTNHNLMVNPSNPLDKIWFSASGPSVPPVSDWFKFDNNDPVCQIDQTVFCGEQAVEFGSDPDESSLNGWDLIVVREGNSNSSPRLKGQKWTSQEFLLDRLHRNPGLVSQNTSVQAFFDQSPNTALGQFHAVKMDLHRLFSPDLTLAQNIDDLRTEISALTEAMIEKDEVVWDTNVSINEKETARTEWEALSTEASMLSDELLVLESEEKALRNAHVAVVLAENDQISASQIFETNRKTFNAIYLQTVGLENMAASTAQINSLQFIAEQCPASGGTAVAEARWLLAKLTGDSEKKYDDEAICAEASERKSDNYLSTIYGEIVPNPANDAFDFRLKSPQNEPVQLEIVNVAGEILASKRLQSGEASITLSTSGLPNGVYFLQTRSRQIPLSVQKLVIAKF